MANLAITLNYLKTWVQGKTRARIEVPHMVRGLVVKTKQELVNNKMNQQMEKILKNSSKPKNMSVANFCAKRNSDLVDSEKYGLVLTSFLWSKLIHNQIANFGSPWRSRIFKSHQRKIRRMVSPRSNQFQWINLN